MPEPKRGLPQPLRPPKFPLPGRRNGAAGKGSGSRRTATSAANGRPHPANGETSSTPSLPSPGAKTGRLFTRFSEVVPEKVEWFWLGRIPMGEITVVDGDPAANKTSAMLDVAARSTTGRTLPGGGRVRCGVLLLAQEDSVRKTLYQRLQAAGADMNRIAVMNGDLTVPGSLKEIEAAAVQLGTKLVIIDPIMGYLSSDAHKEQKVRQAMGPLKAFAERANLAVVLIRHLVKNGGRNALYRGTGSIGIIAAARSGLLIAPSPDDRHMRVLAQYKSNLGEISPSLLFEPVTDGNGILTIKWHGPCPLTAQDLLVPAKGSGKLEAAKSVLLELLRDGPKPQKVVESEAERHQISFRTVERAKDELGIASHRKGFGPGSTVYWELPQDDPQ